jgi:hypothetical protein
LGVQMKVGIGPRPKGLFKLELFTPPFTAPFTAAPNESKNDAHCSAHSSAAAPALEPAHTCYERSGARRIRPQLFNWSRRSHGVGVASDSLVDNDERFYKKISWGDY